MLGADAVIFPNHGGRFGYSPETCRQHRPHRAGRLARPAALRAGAGRRHDARERVPEMLDFYGADIMLLIGGALLEARERLTEATAAFVGKVESYPTAEAEMTEHMATADQHERPIHRRASDDYRWDGVDLLPYKEDDRALFKSITRQVLFSDREHAGRAALFRGGAGRLLDARAA